MLPQVMLKAGEGPPAGGQRDAGGHQDVVTPGACPRAAAPLTRWNPSLIQLLCWGAGREPALCLSLKVLGMILRIMDWGALLQSRINCWKEPAGEISRPLNAGG